MEEYIPKSALVAEIERRINEINLDSIEDWRYRIQREHDIEVMKNILSLLDTLEVKEVQDSAAADIAEEIIINLKRVENDYRIDLTKQMEWLRNIVKKGK